MSRGPGSMQRGVLGALAEQCDGDGWLTVDDLAAHVAAPHPRRAVVESVRRAVKSLGRAGLATVEYADSEVDVRSARVDRGDFYAYRPPHQSRRRVLVAHRLLSVEEETARAQSLHDSLERLVCIDARISGGDR